jgi:hypothetical protein
MASTMTEVAAGQAMMTDKCLDEVFAGNLATSNVFKLVLLNLALGALTLTQAGTAFWSDLSDAETVGVAGYTKGTGITLTGANIPAIASHMKALDFAGVSLDSADFTSDAYALVRWVSTTANSPVLALGKWDVTKTPTGSGTANFTATVVNPIKFSAGAAA